MTSMWQVLCLSILWLPAVGLHFYMLDNVISFLFSDVYCSISFSKDLILSIDGRPPLDRDIPVIKDLSPTDKAVVEWLYGPPGTKPEPPKEDPRRRNRPSHEESVDIGPDCEYDSTTLCNFYNVCL